MYSRRCLQIPETCSGDAGRVVGKYILGAGRWLGCLFQALEGLKWVMVA